MNQRKFKCIGLLFFIVSAIILTGCSTKTHLVEYTPTIKQQESNNIGLTINQIDDMRVKKKKVGALKNLYGMPIVKIITEDDLSIWVTNALKTELSNAGYSIGEEKDYSIEGKVFQAYATSYFIYQGKMEVEFTLKQNDKIILRKNYKTNVDNGINWFSLPKSCMKTLSFNLQEICKQFINDINIQLLNSDSNK